MYCEQEVADGGWTVSTVIWILILSMGGEWYHKNEHAYIDSDRDNKAGLLAAWITTLFRDCSPRDKFTSVQSACRNLTL